MCYSILLASRFLAANSNAVSWALHRLCIILCPSVRLSIHLSVPLSAPLSRCILWGSGVRMAWLSVLTLMWHTEEIGCVCPFPTGALLLLIQKPSRGSTQEPICIARCIQPAFVPNCSHLKVTRPCFDGRVYLRCPEASRGHLIWMHLRGRFHCGWIDTDRNYGDAHDSGARCRAQVRLYTWHCSVPSHLKRSWQAGLQACGGTRRRANIQRYRRAKAQSDIHAVM